MFDVGANVLGKFSVQAQLSPGAFGTVFVVNNFAMNRQSVLKAVACQDPANLRELIEAYSQNCQHPKIAQIYAAELHDAVLGGVQQRFVMMEQEYLPQGSLQAALTGGYMSMWHCTHYMKDVLHALEYLHASGILHGDIKPDNIMVVGESVKLIDFGLAQNMNFVGAPRARDAIYRTHAAPELVGANITEQSDVYAAGITLFRLINQIVDWHGFVTGIPDWESVRNSGRLLARIGFRDEVPDVLRRIARKACHPDPAQRYGSAAEFRRALDQVVFSHRWREIAPVRWRSEMNGTVVEATVAPIRASFALSVRRNKRRLRADTLFSIPVDAERALLRYLKENTANRR
ncbi:serine/threonine-protein kinase [Devosia sp.]|uniref:serine/threonine-protein kinase n=1 Tax=Devosia sp. TaxID=1871048 RepID=UPI003F6FA57B